MVFNILVSTIPLCAITSIEETVKFGRSILVYPNPNSGSVNVDLGDLKDVSILVINSSGQTIYKKEKINTELFQFDIDAAAGSYIMIVSTKEETEYIKFLKY